MPQPSMLLRRLLHRGEDAGRRHARDRCRTRPRGRSRAWPPVCRGPRASGPDSSAPGTASRLAPAATSANASSGVKRRERSKLGDRWTQTRPSSTTTSNRSPGEYGGTPTIVTRATSLSSSSGSSSKRAHTSSTVGPWCAATHGSSDEQPPQPVGRGDAGHRGPTRRWRWRATTPRDRRAARRVRAPRHGRGSRARRPGSRRGC